MVHDVDRVASPGAADASRWRRRPAVRRCSRSFGATAGVRELAGSTWQPLGMDITVAAPIVGEPALAAGAAGKPAIGWVGSDGYLRAYRYDTSWTADRSARGRYRVAARPRRAWHAVAVAYDQYAGSYSVVAAQVTGTTWTFLGRALDIDISGDAVAPAIAYDSSGAPIVAWTELVETNQRGALARWNGSGWTIVGGITWLDDPQAVPSRSRIALDAGDAAVVATSANGAGAVARFNGPRVAALGLTSRASIAGCSVRCRQPADAALANRLLRPHDAEQPGRRTRPDPVRRRRRAVVRWREEAALHRSARQRALDAR